jgi:hypothetical protein
MKTKILAIVFLFVISSLAPTAHAGILDDIVKTFENSIKTDLDDKTIISGLKEALSVGTKNAVVDISNLDGYFRNEMIKILMPEKLKAASELLSQVGFQKEVDEFILSMNRAAEKAAPKATAFFIDAIKEMTFDDAKMILKGGDTAATDFFKRKTYDKLYDAFKPDVSSTMDSVGVTRSYKKMIGKYESLPFLESKSLDLDHYVTSKALDGLFYMIGEEEKKIRTNPAARVTELLKKVFGK